MICLTVKTNPRLQTGGFVCCVEFQFQSAPAGKEKPRPHSQCVGAKETKETKFQQ